MLYGEEQINPVEKFKNKALLELMKRSKEIQQAINKYLASLMFTDWTFETSAGGDFSVSTPVAKLGVVASGGAIYLKNNKESKTHTYRFAGAGATIGVGLIPFPANFSISMPEFFSTGWVYKTPFKKGNLTESDFRGSCLLFQGGAQHFFGLSCSGMLMGGDYSALLPLPGRLLADQIFQIIRSSKAFVPFIGLNLNVIPATAGGSFEICGVI